MNGFLHKNGITVFCTKLHSGDRSNEDSLGKKGKEQKIEEPETVITRSYCVKNNEPIFPEELLFPPNNRCVILIILHLLLLPPSRGTYISHRRRRAGEKKFIISQSADE
jgi:hypothetical protein